MERAKRIRLENLIQRIAERAAKQLKLVIPVRCRLRVSRTSWGVSGLYYHAEGQDWIHNMHVTIPAYAIPSTTILRTVLHEVRHAWQYEQHLLSPANVNHKMSESDADGWADSAVRYKWVERFVMELHEALH